MDENNNLNTNNDFDPISTDPEDIFKKDGSASGETAPDPTPFPEPEPTQETDPMERAREAFSQEPPTPDIPNVNDVAEEIPPEPIPTPEQIARDQYTWTGGSWNGNDTNQSGQSSAGNGNSGYQGSSGNGGYQGGPGNNNYGGGQQQYSGNPNQGYAGAARAQTPPSKALGILSLIFGIVSLVFFCSCINIFTGVAAIIFGIIQLVTGKGTGKGISIAGIVTAALSIILFFVFWGAVLGNANLSDSIIEEYGSDGIEDFLEDYLNDYGIDIEGNFNVDGHGPKEVPHHDDNSQQL